MSLHAPFFKNIPMQQPQIITDCEIAVDFDNVSAIITTRRERFISGLAKSSDLLKYFCKLLL